jgi:hypothetical protein
LDLGKKNIITKIAYAPRIDSDYRMRLILGVFEGANQPDFGDAIPLFIIPGSVERELTEQEITCTRGFRYVRFVFPVVQESGKSSYVSELKFYGYPGEGDNSQLPCITNIPTVSIHTVNAQDITDKENYIQGIVSVISADGKTIHTDSLDIRGRGNNSWSYPKKPYRMKLYKKTSLLGFPAKEKHWTLINNFGDKTLMRNLIGFEVSRRMELPYTPAGIAVNVFLNGDYKGCYQLCDQVEVNPSRVETDEMKPTDTSLPNLSGGYLLEIDAYASGEAVWFSSSTGIPVTVKYPKHDEIVPAQRSYIESQFNKMETATYGPGYISESSGFRRYFDIPSFLRRFLAVEFTGNTDSYWSYYIYKKRNDDKFYSSPIWDLDLAFENDWRTYPINTRNNEWIYASTGSTANGVRELLNRMFTDPTLRQEMANIYARCRDKEALNAEALLQFVDSMALLLDQSQKLNFTRWDIMNQTVHENPVIHGSYAAEVANVKKYISERIVWMDNKLNYIPGSTLSGNADLSDLSVSIGELSPAFTGKTLEYKVTAPSGTTEIEIQGAPADAFAQVEGLGWQAITTNPTELEIKITAENKTTQKVYKITVELEPDTTGIASIAASTEVGQATVYSLQGVMIRRQTIAGNALPVLLEQLAPGCYIVSFSVNNSVTKTKFIVK